MLARRLRPIATTTTLLALLFAAPAAADSLSPAQFIQSLGEETIRAITRTDVPEDARLTEFERLFRKGFDVNTISRFVLGRHWRGASPEQREEYQTLFADFIVTTYASRFKLYSGETLDVNGERKANERDTIVSSEIVVPGSSPIRIDWRVRTRSDAHKIIDVVVEGVSMAITQRDEFASVIRRGGGNIEALISQLREKSQLVN